MGSHGVIVNYFFHFCVSSSRLWPCVDKLPYLLNIIPLDSVISFPGSHASHTSWLWAMLCYVIAEVMKVKYGLMKSCWNKLESSSADKNFNIKWHSWAGGKSRLYQSERETSFIAMKLFLSWQCLTKIAGVCEGQGTEPGSSQTHRLLWKPAVWKALHKYQVKLAKDGQEEAPFLSIPAISHECH